MRVLADSFTDRLVPRAVESPGVTPAASDMNFFKPDWMIPLLPHGAKMPQSVRMRYPNNQLT